MVGECLLQPRQHGFSEIIFNDVSVTVFVDVAQQKDAVCEFVEDKFHVFVVEFREPKVGVELCRKSHFDEESLYVLRHVAASPVFFFELVLPCVDGELFELV